MDDDTELDDQSGSCFSGLWFNGKRGSISMKEGKHFSATTIADAIHASIEEKEGDIFSNFEEHLFDTLRDGKDKVPLTKFLADLKWMGLRTDDPRLRETMRKIQRLQRQSNSRGDDIMMDRKVFRDCITDNIVLIKKAFEAELIIPEFQKFCALIEVMYNKCKATNNGKVPNHLSQLENYDANYWGVSICTIDGQRFSIGDTEIPFALQSTFKPLIYALALNELGPETVHQYVGQEPSGEQFNVIKLDHNNQPHNPMINSGGIVMLSLVKTGARIADRFDYVNEQYKKIAGGEYIGFNNSMYLTERESSNRNYALGYYLQENKCFPKGTSLKDTLDLYSQLCSIEVNTESAAVIAATLANGGICPMTGLECLTGISVQNVLSLMHSCGMYDYSGQFAFKVGLPAKASVSGSILLVIPNVMGICMWAPPLDKYGNSEKGIQFCNELVKNFNFHQYDSLINQVDKIDPRQSKKENMGSDLHALIMAAHHGNLKDLKRMFLAGIDMHTADYDGRTALHLASSEGHLCCVKFLLEKCDVPHSPKDRWDHTPLDEAKTFKHDDVAAYLELYLSDRTVQSSG